MPATKPRRLDWSDPGISHGVRITLGQIGATPGSCGHGPGRLPDALGPVICALCCRGNAAGEEIASKHGIDLAKEIENEPAKFKRRTRARFRLKNKA
jgi:hypothetical protein